MTPPSDSSNIQGLSTAEAERRRRAEGANELPARKPRNVLILAWDLLHEPMILLLVTCGGTYLFIGDWHEALLLIASIAVVIGIELYQESKTERTLEALRDLSSPRALVIRDGTRVRIPGREVVRGDLMVLIEGDRVAADGAMRVGEQLLIDESLLTGESLPVRKSAAAANASVGQPPREDPAAVFAGTLIVNGQGIAEVTATGVRTEMGKIGKSLGEIPTQATRVQQEMSRIVRVFAIIGISLCVLTAILYGLTRGNWLQGLLAGLTLAIAMVPEELPVVLTVFLALGAWRIAQQHVLTRRTPALEMLGSATVLCVDKTGTLTMNRMSVQELVAHGASPFMVAREATPLSGELAELVAVGVLASHQESVDPTEQALHQLAARVPATQLRHDWTLVREHPFSRVLLAVAYVWRSPDGASYLVAMKGAPEAVAGLCHVQGVEAARIAQEMAQMASRGLRVLGVARAVVSAHQAGEGLQHLPFEWLGLVGMADPVRPGVPEAVRECYGAGIRVLMVTGDYPATAQSIASQIGLESSGTVITGAALDQMDEAALARCVRTSNIFARIVPEQKLRIVNALKANGEVVAMTGDGVNDAPALKAAQIGIAMGARGTDVAREAADLVLLDDDFSSIVKAIRLGRRIFDNLTKATAYLFAIHVPIAGMSLIPVMWHWPMVLLPVHIVFLELIIDPACSIVFETEPEEATVMQRPPRHPQAPIFRGRTIGLSVLQGVSVLLMVLTVFVLAMVHGKGEAEARTLTFTSLIIGNLALIFTNRSWSRTILETLQARNLALWSITAGALLFLGLILYVPPLQAMFHFATLHVDDLAQCLLMGSIGIVWFELLKFFSRRLPRRS